MSSRINQQNDLTAKDLLDDMTVEEFWIHMIIQVLMFLKSHSTYFCLLFSHIYEGLASQQCFSTKQKSP